MRALQRTLAKDAENAEIKVTCLKGKESSQLFSSLFRDDMQRQPPQLFYKNGCS